MFGRFYREVEGLSSAHGHGSEDQVHVCIRHSSDMSEFEDWPIQRLFAVTDLEQGNPQSIDYRASQGGSFSARLHHGYNKALVLEVVTPTAEEASALLHLGSRLLSGEPASAPPSAHGSSVETTSAANGPTAPANKPGVLSWLEHHPLYRALAIIGTVAAGIGAIGGAILWLVGRVH